ncbi:hypothetical protein PVK06_000513 [Gossypium arboreum]|uniref:Uncharacterized protein n=1 Tax=Gossypium arboreum TaxID=29729 RepID=A0ABR0QYJ7_GOSAR|nr:hypothetical protein PVK06_000513 [Gossypium arboreum]
MEETPSFSWPFLTLSEPKWVPRRLGCRRPPIDDRIRVKVFGSDGTKPGSG